MAPQTSVPPSLPPSVEEAYRRKCVQLKNRTNEVEESNHAARLRLARLKRQVEKMRLERAFLLEQLAKRTSANVEDSEGSPSPPPTPKDKPLRIKRGHRKASIGGDADSKSGAPGDATELGDGSPSKKAAASRKQRRRRSQTNGVSPAPPPLPATVFDMFADEKREEAAKKNKGEDSSADVPTDADLEAEWKDLAEEDKAAVEKRYEELKEKIRKHEEEVAQGEADAEAEAEAEAEEEEAEAEAEAEEAAAAAADAATPRPTKSSSEPKAESKSPAPEKAPAATQDEDVEMADNDNDTEDGDMQVDKDGDA